MTISLFEWVKNFEAKTISKSISSYRPPWWQRLDLSVLMHGLRARQAWCSQDPSGVDQYEASLWKITNERCIQKIQKVKVIDLEDCGAVQVGINGVDDTDAQCQFNGAGCKNIFALSLPRVISARSINYFIAAAASRNSGKRMLTNAEWQAAALGTPGSLSPKLILQTECNSENPMIALTGSHSKCKSDIEAYHGRKCNRICWRLGSACDRQAQTDVFIPGFGGDSSNMGGAPNGTVYGLPGTTLRGGAAFRHPTQQWRNRRACRRLCN